MTPEEQARFEALERRVDELERGRPPARSPWKRPGPPAVGPAEAPPPGAELGLNWISRIAVVTVVLALAFFFQYASRTG